MLRPLFAFGLATLACTADSPSIPKGTTTTLAVLETTDLHSHVLSYDYFKLQPDLSYGLERTATLIRGARATWRNSVLFDNGDTIQGNALADQQALVAPLKKGQTLAIHRAMNALGYDAATVGNHEFNYGLDFLARALGHPLDGRPQGPKGAGPAFPIVCANLLDAKTGRPLFAPYTLLRRTVEATTPDGRHVKVPLTIGVIGFCTPWITTWDRRWLEGKVQTLGLKESAAKYLPEMRAKGAEVIIALSHGGFSAAAYDPGMENGNLHLAQVEGLDALLTGHAHQVFPGTAYRDLPGVDAKRGRVAGLPTVMAGFWGSHLGVVRLSLVYDGTRWHSDREKAEVDVQPIQTRAAGAPTSVDPDPALAKRIAKEHAATLVTVQKPIGRTRWSLGTALVDVGEASAVQVVNEAQTQYVAAYVKANLPELAQVPVLSLSAPFKAGHGGGRDYTDIPAGPLAVRHAADLYPFPNTLYAVKISGDDLRAWLETAAQRFRTIDPAKTAAQPLQAGFPPYNFDLATSPDLRYEIDVTRPVPAWVTASGSVPSPLPEGRIRELRWKGQPVTADMTFIVATNNYRASGGGSFRMLTPEKVILASPDANRDVLIAYLRRTPELPAPVCSWRFTRVNTAGPVTFASPPGALERAKALGLDGISLETPDNGKGLSVYRIDLSK